jgi:DNA-binding transcriptional MerR regulator
VSRAPGEQAGDPEHHRRGIDPSDRSAEPGCTAGGGTWPASDVGHCVTRNEFAEALGQAGVTLSDQHHAGSGEESSRPGEARVAGVVIRDADLPGCHVQTLTVEPGFTSSGSVAELMTIGEVADRAHVATSTIRYYERRGLLSADARQSGQRRYRIETLRRLVFIGMMQDIGLTLDEVYGILHAATVAEWKPIAGQHVEALGRVRQVTLPPAARALSTLSHVDYGDAFLVETGQAQDRTGEQWARAILEDAPMSTRNALSRGWSALGLRLGSTQSDRFVLASVAVGGRCR